MESDKIQKMREKLLICSVCMEDFDDPRILPCHHTFCLTCIESLVNSLPINSRSLCCPQCRTDVAIPRYGINKFPVNFYLVNLEDELGAAAKVGMCHLCGLAQNQFHCMDCDKSVCRFCIARHRLQDHEERSRIVRLSTGSSPYPLTSNLCEEHSGEMLQLFCTTCQKAICITCSCSQEHKRHNLVPMSKQLQEIKIVMQKELDKVVHELQQAKDSISLVKSCKETLLSSSNESVFNLNQFATKSCETIMKLKSKMESEIKSSVEIEMAKMNDVETKIEAYLDMLDKGHDYLSNLQDNDICMEAIESYNKFSTSVTGSRDDYTSTNVLLQHKSFIPLYDINAINFNVGSIKTHFLYGNLGFVKSKLQNLYVNKKTLEVISKPRFMFSLPSSGTLVKISLFITFFYLFNIVLSQFDKQDSQTDGLRIEFTSIGEEISKFGKEITDFGTKAFEDLFIPP